MRLRTTVVGSYPAGEMLPEAALERAVRDQVAAGIDLLSDGQVRSDMLSAFLAYIPGCERRPDGGWTVTGRLGAPAGPITVGDWLQASRLAKGRPVKGILTGPTTLACAVTVGPGAPYAGPGDSALVRDFAAVLAGEAAALVGAGARVVQVDEPFFSAGPDVDEGLEAVRRVTAAVPEPWLHCCGDIRAAWPLLRSAPVVVLQIEGTRPDRLPPLREGALPGLGLGVIDSATDEVEEVAAVRARIRALLALGAPGDVWLSPDCGLRLRHPEVAAQKLAVLGEAATY